MRAILIALAMVAGCAASAAERLPALPTNIDYRDARRDLMALGFTPVQMPGADICTKGDGRCQGFPEMESCSGTGLGYCSFIWRSKGGMLVQVITAGEHNPGVNSVRCRANCK